MKVLSFALPEESKGVTSRLEGAMVIKSGTLPLVRGRLAGQEVIVMHTGMGMDSAQERVGEFLDGYKPDVWIAGGFGGALSPELEIGDLVLGSNFSGQRLLDAIAGSAARVGEIITTHEVIETAEKKVHLGRHTGALVVEMETAAIHRHCVRTGVPMLAVRAVSDTAREDLPVPAEVWFDMARQRPRVGALLGYLALRPSRIGRFARFVGGVGRAREALTAFLLTAVGRV